MATNGSSPPAPPPATLRRRTMRRVALLVALAAFIVVPTRSFPSTAMWSSSSSLRSSSSNRGGRTLGPVGPATSSPSASARARAGTLAGRSIRPRDARDPWRLRSSVDGNDGSQSDGGGGGGGRRSQRRKPRLPSKNLYDILGADPSMSRTEIKRLYLSLARETHPDAAPSNRGADGLAAPSDGGGRFNEVSQAWTILSDPRTRRAYDRDVAAEALKSDVVRRASEAAREYGPAARSLFEDVAIPFLRRTTTTAVAGWDAVTAEAGASGGAATPSEVAGEASELEDFGRAFQRVIEAGRNATRRVDGMELREKSEELRRRADGARAASMVVLERLTKVKSERLRLTFLVPSANFTSTDAVQFMEGYDGGEIPDEVTLVQRMTFKHPVRQDIEALAAAEAEVSGKAEERSSLEGHVRARQRSLMRANDDAQAAMQAEERARKMLEEAQQRMTQAQQMVGEAQRVLQELDVEVRRSDHELSKATATLKRKQDVVRRVLRKKAGEVEGTVFDQVDDGTVRLNPSFDRSANPGAALEALREDERRAEGEFLGVVDKASRLASRSERLGVRSEELIGEQEMGDLVS